MEKTVNVSRRFAPLCLTEDKDLIVLSGTSLLMTPLGDVLSEHYFGGKTQPNPIAVLD